MISRKTFLTMGSLSAISLFVPKIFIAQNVTPGNENAALKKLLKNAADWRKQNKLAKAKQAYLQIINTYPQEIRGYYGLRKTILAQPKNVNKELEFVQIVQNAVKKFPANDELKTLLNKEYIAACLGNKKLKRKLNLDKQTLQKAKNEFGVSVQQKPSKNQMPNRKLRLLDANAQDDKP